MSTNIIQTASRIWSLADLLRGDFRQSEYGRIILPFIILHRLESMLAARKPLVLEEVERLNSLPHLGEEARVKSLLNVADQLYYNTSPLELSRLGSIDTKNNLLTYVDSFSWEVREIFEHLGFDLLVNKLAEANVLYQFVQNVNSIDLSPGTLNNHEIGLVFEELIRLIAESSYETAGEHFTPRDILGLITSLVFAEQTESATTVGPSYTIYDPTVGTGGFLMWGMEYLRGINADTEIQAFGQEINSESYAICKGWLLLRGQDPSQIKLGDTLCSDQFQEKKFDYMFSNPPFGMAWKRIEDFIKTEHEDEGFHGRFGPGLPRTSDSSLLFLMHLLSKMRNYDPSDKDKQGSRIGIMLNGAPLFLGAAGSGESEIRRYILENDLLEAIVALPTDLFYNTGIATYVWILSNKKGSKRKGRVLLINGVHLYQKMRKSLGSKRKEITSEDIELIKQTLNAFESIEAYDLDEDTNEQSTIGGTFSGRKKTERRTFASKVFANHEFGYRRIRIERPLRSSVQFSDERLEDLRFSAGTLNGAMRVIYDELGQDWTDETYGQLDNTDLRMLLNANAISFRDKQIKDLLNPITWRVPKNLFEKAKALQRAIGLNQFDDFNRFEEDLKRTLKKTGIRLDAKEKKLLYSAVTWTNPHAEPVIKRVLKTDANPKYGAFDYKGKVVTFRADNNLRDFENVPLTSETARGVNVNAVNEEYFEKEIAPYMPDAWINEDERDKQDGEIGIVGFEIPFTRLFFEFTGTQKNLNLTKIKTLISRNNQGKYFWNVHQKRLMPAIDNSQDERVEVDEGLLDIDYFNAFLQSAEGREWIRYNAIYGMHNSYLSLSRLMECELHLPVLDLQKKIVRLSEEYESLLDRILLIRPRIFNDPNWADGEIQKYLDISGRYENEFTHILPHPLAILWTQARATIDVKTQCQEYVKFYEYLGLFSLSVILGQLNDEEAGSIFERGKGKANKPHITMGTSSYLLPIIKEKFSDQIHPLFKPLMSEAWIKLLKDATEIRNDIAHRGLHAKAFVNSCKRRLDPINDQVATLSRNLFEQIVLIRPKSAKLMNTYGGPVLFLNTVDTFRGLALNPAIATQIETSEPMVDGELYFAVDNSPSVQKPHRIFPLMKLMDTDDESGIIAFYFYNKWDQEIENHIYVCPYPSLAYQKTLSGSPLFPNK